MYSLYRSPIFYNFSISILFYYSECIRTVVTIDVRCKTMYTLFMYNLLFYLKEGRNRIHTYTYNKCVT